MATYTERNRQVIRQWEILKRLEEHPSTISELVLSVGDDQVCKPTIRRDLEALEAAGFPLYSERHEDGAIRWRVLTKGVVPARRIA